ncbi:MAG TPA: hypothetical protein VN642_19150 [Dongiaceae bacterium]|nr:hypothetical protein [Dongiaceae bacterium]
MIQRTVLIVLSAFLLGGCAIGTTHLQVTHEPLERIEAKKQGNIQIKPFIDKRKEDHQHIGNKRNGFGMVLGHVAPEEGVKLESLLTTYFAEALKEAGYNTVIQDSETAGKQNEVKFDAVVDGEIVEFWLDLYLKVWQNIEVKTRAIQPATQAVLWENTIKADQSNVLWVGATGEFEKVINEALTKALNQAAKEYASDQFQQAIKAKTALGDASRP